MLVRGRDDVLTVPEPGQGPVIQDSEKGEDPAQGAGHERDLVAAHVHG